MADSPTPSSPPTYDYRDLAFYIKCAVESGTPSHALMQLPRLAFLPPEERQQLINRACADPVYKRQHELPIAVLLLVYFIALPLSVFFTARAGSSLIHRFTLDHTFGPGTYASGVRIVDKHGRLSDGRILSGVPRFLNGFANVALFFTTALLYFALVNRIFGRTKNPSPSPNGYRLHLLLRKRPPPS